MASNRWYCSWNGQQGGPFSAAQLKQMAAAGRLQPTDLVFREGNGKWVSAGSVKGLFPSAHPRTPAPVPSGPPRRFGLWILTGAGVAGVAAGVLLAVLLLTQEREGEPPPEVAAQGKKAEPELLKFPSEIEPARPNPKPEEKQGAPELLKPPTEPARQGPDLDRLLQEGLTALKAREYDAAVKAFHEAATLAPGHEDALAALGMAQRALAEHERQTTFRTFLDSGLTNLANKEYDAAVVALDEALKLKPGDPEALAARQRAEKESAASRDAQARAEFQKKAEQYRKWMADGKTALFVTQDYEAAVAAFTQANQLFPTDRASAQLREQAEQARARQAAVEAPQPKGDARTRQRVRGLLAVALRAQSERDWKAAELALEEAWKLAPEDPAVRAALRDLEQQRLGADPEQERRWAAYYQVMRVGRDAVAAGGYPAAIRAFTEAIQLVQGDRDAVSLRLAAEKELAAAQVAYLTVQAAEKRLRQIVDDGYRALAANQVPTAMKALAVARELAPNHPLVAQLATAIENQRAAPAPKKVPEGPAFTLEVPQSVNLVAGGKTKVQVTVERKGYQGQIEVRLKGKLPAGVTASTARIDARQSSAEIELSAAANTAVGKKGVNVYVIGVPRGGGPEVSSDRFTLTISARKK